MFSFRILLLLHVYVIRDNETDLKNYHLYIYTCNVYLTFKIHMGIANKFDENGSCKNNPLKTTITSSKTEKKIHPGGWKR